MNFKRIVVSESYVNKYNKQLLLTEDQVKDKFIIV